jgi:hypothetical protein
VQGVPSLTGCGKIIVLRTKLFWLIALCALAGSAGSYAAEISLVRGAKGEEDVITVKGEFKLGDENKFRSIAIATNKATVYLDSPGGKIHPAFEIGKIIRIKGFSTAVQEAVCASACAMVWLAGEPRMMSNFTSVGFHAPYSTDKSGKTKSDATHGALVGSYLTSLGFSQKAVMFVVTASADEMHWLQKSTADKLGIAVTFTTPAQRRKGYEAFLAGISAIKATPPAKEDAARSYRLSADQGYAGAQNNLGDLYETGLGVPKSVMAAIYWYTRAAERGEPTAYLSLASLLSKDTTDPEILIEALKYAALAYNFLPAGTNKTSAEALSTDITAKLTRVDRQRVLELVTRWAPLYQEERLMGDKPNINSISR